MSILTDRDILKAMDDWGLVIKPFDRAQLGSNSYDVRLGDQLLTYKLTDEHGLHRPLDCRVDNATVRWRIPDEGFALQPGILYLGSTVEYTESPRHAPKLNGKSSLGRLGLFVHATAGEGDVGFRGRWTLEMTVVHPLVVYAGMPVAQLLWSTITSAPERAYGERSSSKYDGQSGPTSSRMHRNFEPADSTAGAGPIVDPATVCTECGKPWSEHWGFNCDEPYADRKFRPLLPGRYPGNRGLREDYDDGRNIF